jgi:hypothetical protein
MDLLLRFSGLYASDKRYVRLPGGISMTKRIAGLITLCFFISMVAHAQFLTGFGIKGGVASAKQIWDYKMNINFPTETRRGIDAGVFVEILNSPCFVILAELHYVQKGFKLTLPMTILAQPDGTGEVVTKKPRLEYLSFPLIGKLRFHTGAIIPYVFGGPRLDFLIGRKTEGHQAVLDHLKSIDAGVSVGLGIEVPLTIVPAVLVEFRYSPSLSEAFSNDALTVKNQSIEFLLGLRM